MAKPHVVGSLMVGAGALMVWASSRMAWLKVTAFDDKSGEKAVDVVGALWSNETTAVALVLAVSCLACLVLKRLGRRIVAILAAIVAAWGAWAPLKLMTSEPDAARALSLLSSDNASSKQSEGALLSSWAQITEMSIQIPAGVVALLGCALALFGAVIVAKNPGKDPEVKTKYQRKQEREATIIEDLDHEPDSGRVLWDAIDADIDPTDRQRG